MHTFSIYMQRLRRGGAALAWLAGLCGLLSGPAAIAEEPSDPSIMPFADEADLIALGGVVLSDAEVTALFVGAMIAVLRTNGDQDIYLVHEDLTLSPMMPWGGGSFRVAGDGIACFAAEPPGSPESCWRHYRFDDLYFRVDLAGAADAALMPEG